MRYAYISQVIDVSFRKDISDSDRIHSKLFWPYVPSGLGLGFNLVVGVGNIYGTVG